MENLKNSEPNFRKDLLISLALNLIMLAFGLFNLYYINDMENQIIKRDIIIRDLTYSDSILNKVIEPTYDSVSKSEVYTYRTVNGEIMKYNTAIKELDKSNEDYDELIRDYNLLAKKYDSVNDSLSNYQILVDLINEKYKIKYKIGEKNISIEAKQLDSALVLLPYFRNRLSIDGNKWIIETLDNK